MYTVWWVHTVWAHSHDQPVCRALLSRARKGLSWKKDRLLMFVTEHLIWPLNYSEKDSRQDNSEEHSRSGKHTGNKTLHVDMWISVSHRGIKVLGGTNGFSFNQFMPFQTWRIYFVVLWYFVWKWSDVIEIQNHFTHVKTCQQSV